MCNRELAITALFNNMPSELKGELTKAFEDHPRLRGYFNEGHFMTLYVALNGEGLGELRNRLMDHIASL